MAAPLHVSHAEAQATPGAHVESVVPSPFVSGSRYPLVFAIALAGVFPAVATACATRWIPRSANPSCRTHQPHEITGGACLP
jgi:hypothetical protein